ncbi:Metallophosphoesterase [Candidatus Zixiibacteriota bacterium]|nr:Metallophosphoesterase [candidate division Zixibacteria bacterium]
MKNPGFMIFFAIVLTIYALVNFYIFIRGWQAIPRGSVVRIYYLAIFLFVALSFIAGRFLERAHPSLGSEILVWIGSFWLAAMLYFFLAVVLLDLSRLVNHFFPFYPSAVTADYGRAKFMTAIVAVIIVFLTVSGGFVNALTPHVRRLTIDIPRKAAEMKEVNLVAVSDIHLGTLIGRRRLNDMVAKINALKPDIIILAGDVVDEDIGPVIRDNLGEMLRTLQAPLGVYAITGNHEYYAGVEAVCRYLTEHGVTMLRDSTIKVNKSFNLIGREDREKTRFTGVPRRTLDALMTDVEPDLPVIVLDHQPFQLGDVVKHGADLQISGHTHHGQLWPLTYVTDAIYQLSVGYRKIENTSFYVSSGFGTWGPPVRTGNRPEIMQIKLRLL